jgi:hypothetical protein
MATTSLYAIDLAGAYSQLTTWINSNQNLIAASGFTITYVGGSLPKGGYFLVNYNFRAGGTGNTTYCYSGLASSSVGSIGYICRNRYWITPVNFAGLTTPGPSVMAIVTQLQTARAEALADVCGATVSLQSPVDWTYPGQSAPYYAHAMGLAATEYDCAFEAVQALDLNQYGLALGGVAEAYFPQFPTAGPTLQFYPSVSQGAELLDMDVAINNGANIFSVVSRTFTEPGP